MDPNTFGVIATLNLFVMYSTFSSLGTLSAAEVKLPYYLGKGDKVQFEQIRSATFAFTILTGLSFSVAVALWAIAARSRLDEYLFMGVLVYCIYFFTNQIASYYITLLRANHEFVFLGKYQFVSGLLTCAGNLTAVWIFGFKGFLAVAIIIVLIQVITLVAHVGFRPTFRISWVELKMLLMSGFPMLIIGLSTQGLKTVDNFLVLRILDIEQLGLYTIALMGGGIIYSATNSISNVLYPRMQEAYGKSGTSDTMRSYVIRPSLIMAVVLPAMIGILYFLIPMVVNWLIPKFELGIFPFKVIVLSTYFFAMVNMLTGYLISIGKQKILVLINMAVLILIVGIAAMLDSHNLGLGGIALATGSGYFACFLVVSIFVLRHWADWNQTLIFLKDTTLSFFFSLALILIIENYWHSSPIGNAGRLFDSLLQLFIFLVLYMPCIILSDRKTRLISDFVIPLFDKTEKSQ